MILPKRPAYKFYFFVIILFIINVLQSYFTKLFEDEAYYWVWSKNMAFGYFDHPPLVAVWIKISSYFFNNELGVRFFSTISFSIMLFVIWKIIDDKKKWNYVWLYFLLLISVVLIQVFGFVTTPDTPLFLFISLFLLSYKQFLVKDNWKNILFLAFSMAGLLYSKYHGVLVIAFVVLSNIKLLKNKQFWYTALIALILFLPHIIWQINNDFPSIVYHLKDRSKHLYSIENTLLFLVNLLVIIGLPFYLFYKALFKKKVKSLFDKSLVYIIYGFSVFFFLSSFNSMTQAQWLGPILIPLIIISYPYFIKHPKERKILVVLGLIQFTLLLLVRVFLANENISPIELETHIAKHWVYTLKDKTESKPIVFINSYRNASIYQFYTGINTHSYSILRGRKSQYDLSDFEEKMQGKDIFVVGKSLENYKELAIRKNRPLRGKPIDNYTTFQKVEITLNDDLKIEKNKNTLFEFKFTNTYNKNINFEHVKFIGVIQGKKNKIIAKIPIAVEGLTPLSAFDEKILKGSIIGPNIDLDENTTFRVALQFYDLLEGFQGNKVKIK